MKERVTDVCRKIAMQVGRSATKRGGIRGKREGRVFTHPLVGCVGSDFNVGVFPLKTPSS